MIPFGMAKNSRDDKNTQIEFVATLEVELRLGSRGLISFIVSFEG